MLKEKTKPKPDTTDVQQKIVFEDQLPFRPEDKTGPTIEYFFHELDSDPTIPQKTVSFLTKLVLTYAFIASMPVCVISLWLFSGRPIFKKTKVAGKRGIVFDHYSYATQFNSEKEDFLIGQLIHKLGFHKLPSVINLWKGEMAVVGPDCYCKDHCNRWNKALSDYYKRFTLKPGFFGVAAPIDECDDRQQVTSSLQQEFRYIINPTLKKDLKHIVG